MLLDKKSLLGRSPYRARRHPSSAGAAV